MTDDFQVTGRNDLAPFTLKVHRGEGMALLAMNWKSGQHPPQDFVGFAIEYKEPNGDRFFALKNRLAFTLANGKVNHNRLSTRLSPIQNSVGCNSRATPSCLATSSTGSRRCS